MHNANCCIEMYIVSGEVFMMRRFFSAGGVMHSRATFCEIVINRTSQFSFVTMHQFFPSFQCSTQLVLGPATPDIDDGFTKHARRVCSHRSGSIVLTMLLSLCVQPVVLCGVVHDMERFAVSELCQQREQRSCRGLRHLQLVVAIPRLHRRTSFPSRCISRCTLM